MKKILFIVLGFVFFGLGAIGAFLPVLPTTPFLLLASYCFARGSEKFHRWFMGTELYGKYLASYVKDRAMTLSAKLRITSLAAAMLLLAFCAMDNVYGRAVVLVVLVVKYWYFFFRIKTIPPENLKPETETAK